MQSCLRQDAWEHSSVGSERLPYKQRVGGSTPSAPTEKSDRNYPVALFVMMKVETPGPLLGGISRASEDGVSEGNARAEMPETGRRTVSACPWGLSRSDWGIDGRALACQGLGFDSLCSH